MSAVAAPATAAGGRPVGAGRLSPVVVRLAAFAALALFAAVQWGALEEPSSRGRMIGCAGIALAAAGATHLAGRLAGAARAAALVGIHLAALAAVLLAAGVPLRMLDPELWGDLATGLSQGVESLPTLGVPYRGVDPWIHIVLVTGGGLLLVLGGFLAVRALRRDRRPLGAGLVLATAYVIPIVERSPDTPFLWGAVFTVLVGALLWADRIERAHAAPALVFVAVAVAGALLASPRLDADEPWIDYQGIVESLSTPPAIGFDWDHGYGPLDWPRENRVMLRIASSTPTYWKAVDLETFDGFRWSTHGRMPPGRLTEVAPNHADWTRKVRVSIRDLRSPYYITAGVANAITNSPRDPIPSGPGTFTTGREPLRRGDTYAAEVYTPNPSVRELRAAGTDYPEYVVPYLTMELPPEVGGPVTATSGAPSTLGPVRLEFPQFSVLSLRTPPAAVDELGAYYGNGGPLLQDSQYAETYALARRMREGSSTPYEFVRAVQERLSKGYRYTETPPRPRDGRPPLASFLFDSRAGYCQQFSGAMALLLRMGGVPARVSSGFSPGTFDEGRDEWVVRDVDAHSWVEAYFPGLGWVTFDPTPGVAPPHTQLLNGPAPLGATEIPLRSDSRRADVPDRSPAGAAAAAKGATVPAWAIVLAALLAGALVGAVLVLLGRRSRDGDAPQLAELERALRLTGRTIEPTLTLQALERRFGAHAPAAAAYVAAVRLARFGGRPQRPTAQQRAALRSELAAGLGWSGRLRAWWALPPAWMHPGAVYNEA